MPIRSYYPNELLEKVEQIGGQIPPIGKYLIVGVQSQEDVLNCFDDVFYVFDGHILKQISSGTTNTGKFGLYHFDDYNTLGVAVWKTNQWYSDLYTRGIHNSKRNGGGMRALCQINPVFYFRDNNRNTRAEEIGEMHSGITGLNMHGVDYNPFSTRIANLIDKWSVGCQVWNRMGDYRQMINAVWMRNHPVDYALLKEF